MGRGVWELEEKLKNSKSKILSGKWIWPFQFDPFLWVRGTRPAHSAPALVTLSHSRFSAPPASSPPPCLHAPLFHPAPPHPSEMLDFYACSIMCWQISSSKDSKRGHQDVSFKSDKQSETSPSLSFHLSFGGAHRTGGKPERT